MDEHKNGESDDLDPGAGKTKALLNAYQKAVDEDKTELAEHNAMLFMAHASEEMARNPPPDLLLKREANRLANAGEWARTEEIYLQLLADAIADGNPAKEFKANDDLSMLHSFLGHTERASETASAAVDAARRADLHTFLSMALERQARNFLKRGNPVQARTLAEELLATIPDAKLNDNERARALVLRASCRVECGELSEVQADLDAAHVLFQPMAGMPMFAGVQSGLAGLWDATARLRAAHGDLETAVEAQRKSVEYRRVVSQQPHLEGPYKFGWLAQSLRHYGTALLAINSHKAAEEAFEEARALLRAVHHPNPDA